MLLTASQVNLSGVPISCNSIGSVGNRRFDIIRPFRHDRPDAVMDWSAPLEYAVQMVERTKNDLASHVRSWIRLNPKENSRLEFKLRVDLSTPGARAEFIKDVIALANSEGEAPRIEAHLVIGFKKGECRDVTPENYDGATFSQILEAHVFPHLKVTYEEVSNRRKGRLGVLIITPDSEMLYLVRKKLVENGGRQHLLPGQSWGRKSDRKEELSGDQIHKRQCDIADRKVWAAITPLSERIVQLERDSGPSLEVKRIRWAMESTQDWDDLERSLEKLIPYAREFDRPVKDEVISAIHEATCRTRDGMTVQAAQFIDSLLAELLPPSFGGMYRASHRTISEDDLTLLRRIEQQTFALTWDTCRYLRDVGVMRIAARRYFALLRATTIKGLTVLQKEFLHNLRRCQEKCYEDRRGSVFPAGAKLLEEAVDEGLNVPDLPKRSAKRPQT
jgi:hypothetical protein